MCSRHCDPGFKTKWFNVPIAFVAFQVCQMHKSMRNIFVWYVHHESVSQNVRTMYVKILSSNVKYVERQVCRTSNVCRTSSSKSLFGSSSQSCYFQGLWLLLLFLYKKENKENWTECREQMISQDGGLKGSAVAKQGMAQAGGIVSTKRLLFVIAFFPCLSGCFTIPNV